MSDTMQRGGGLTEKQIRWCRTNLPSFDFAWRQVKQADEHAAKVREKLEKAA
jgi:hypothetical protein